MMVKGWPLAFELGSLALGLWPLYVPHFSEISLGSQMYLRKDQRPKAKDLRAKGHFRFQSL